MNVYSSGQPVTIQETFLQNGALVDPSGITLTVTDPNGTSTSYNIGQLVHLSLGVWEYVVTPGVTGLWLYHWTSTNPGVGADGQFQVTAFGVPVPFKAMVGPSTTFDAVAYCRARMGDTLQPPFQIVSDSAYELYVEAVASEYSRYNPLGDFLVGGSVPTYTSPLVTVANQQRYLLSSIALSPTPSMIRDVLWLIGNQPLAGMDLAFFTLQPYADTGRFALSPSEMSTRLLRDSFFSELDHYGYGFYSDGVDASGNIYIDLWPTPVQAGLPILLRYWAEHTNTGDYSAVAKFPTVPDRHKKLFGDLLYATLLENETENLTKNAQDKAGMTARFSDPGEARKLAADIRDRVEQALGHSTPVIMVS